MGMPKDNIYSAGSLIDLGGGRWKCRYSRTKDGTRRQVTRSFEAQGKRAARRRAEEIRRELDNEARRKELPLGITADDMLVPAFLERYIRSLESGSGIAQTTAANYRQCAKQISRYLSLVKVDEITGDTILQMQAALLEDGLCNNTVAKDHRFLKQAMQYAEDSGIIDRTPFTRRVRPPKRETREPNALEAGGRERLLLALDSMQDTEVTLAIRLGLACGLRREEMCGLRWKDVDLDTHLLRIRIAVCQCEGKAVVKEPKTPTSRREVPLEPDLERRLAQRRRRIAEEAGTESLEAMGDLYVLGNAEGAFYYPDRLTKEFTSVVKMLGLVGITGKLVTLHDLRHTYATYLVAAGTDIKTVSSLMGHANAAMTLNTYASADPHAKRSAVKIIEQQMAARPPLDGVGRVIRVVQTRIRHGNLLAGGAQEVPGTGTGEA